MIAGSCRHRCGGARIRLTNGEYMMSGWSHAASWAELILGREMPEHEQATARRDVVLN